MDLYFVELLVVHRQLQVYLQLKIKDAFESTLSDLVSGNLQLGGNTTKGHGAFTGNFQTS